MLATVKTFSAITEEFVEVVMRHNPVLATDVGIHDYDHKLPNDSPDGFRERSAWLRDLEQRLVASVPWEELPAPQRIEYALLRSRIASMRADLEEIKVQARNPALFPETALHGLHMLMMRPFAPLDERKEAILARMMAVPEYLGAAQTNLTKIPELLISIASEVTSAGPEFVDGIMQSLRESFPGEAERIEEAARRFVEGKRLAPIPSGRLEIVDTPLFQRSLTPYAAYLRPGPFEEEAIGYLVVTPVDPGKSRAQQQEQIQGHNYVALSLTAVHEAWPGHHLQFAHAVNAGSRLRRLSDSPVLAEGWALYCEELMVEEGFHLDPLARVYQLKDLLWRACRVVLDVGLHTGTMTYEQAVDYLVEQAMLERVNAESEVKRYAMTPTQPMSYLVGSQQIKEIRDEVKSRLGKRYNLYDFHKALLNCGTVPPALVRMELEEQLRA